MCGGCGGVVGVVVWWTVVCGNFDIIWTASHTVMSSRPPPITRCVPCSGTSEPLSGACLGLGIRWCARFTSAGLAVTVL